MTLKQFAMKYPKLATVLICVAGFAFGNVAAILLAYGFTGHAPKESDLTLLGLTTGILFVTLARHCGILPAPEDADKPITYSRATSRAERIAILDRFRHFCN